MTHTSSVPLRHAPRLAAVLALVTTATAAAAQNLPQPRNHVDDRAHVINDNVERQLISALADLEHKTGAQVIVLTIDTTGGDSIDDYTIRTAERWQLGQTGKDNGVLIVIAVKDRKYRIEVGYGLEGALPDGFVGSIGRDYFRPYFRRNDYATGIQQGVLAIVRKVAKEYNVTIAAAAAAPTRGQRSGQGRTSSRGRRTLFGSCGILPIFLFIILINIFRSRVGYHRRWGGGSSSWLTWMLLGSMMGGGRRYGGGGGWGGGFGGGGFGGGSFGGGGGGSFGGGGASGGW